MYIATCAPSQSRRDERSFEFNMKFLLGKNVSLVTLPVRMKRNEGSLQSMLNDTSIHLRTKQRHFYYVSIIRYSQSSWVLFFAEDVSHKFWCRCGKPSWICAKMTKTCGCFVSHIWRYLCYMFAFCLVMVPQFITAMMSWHVLKYPQCPQCPQCPVPCPPPKQA